MRDVARLLTTYLNQAQIIRFVWPARSPELIPVEHVWDKVKKNDYGHMWRHQFQRALPNIDAEIGQSSTRIYSKPDMKHGPSYGSRYKR